MYIAALDIGGTKTIAAILDEKGACLVQDNFPSIVASYEEHLALCVQTMKRLMGQMGIEAGDVAGLGVSLPGIVDDKNGVLIYAPYANWKNVRVADVLRKELGIAKICCENDVNACAIGELKFGLGEKYSDFVWMTVSTGVGGAVVENAELLRGAHGFAGELGHLKVEYAHPELCPCGQYGCLEAHGSGTALIRETRKNAQVSPDFADALRETGLKSEGAACAALAKAGNADAQEIMNQIGTYLGRGISYCVNILDTQAIVIGGGVAASFELLLPCIKNVIEQSVHKSMQNVEILKTPLGYEAALLGAAALVLE